MKFILGIFLSSIAMAQVPTGVEITSVRAKGSGCVTGTVSAAMTDDGQSFSILMDQYTAETKQNLNLDYKTCRLEIGVRAPAGWSFAVMSVDYRGFAQAEAGSQVSHQVLYSFDGSRPVNERPGFGNSTGRYSFQQKIFRGPIAENYYIRNVIDPSTSLWSPCLQGAQQPLIVDTYLIAQSPPRQGGSSVITLDSVDGAIEQKFALSWKQCSNTGRPTVPGRGESRPNPPRFPGRR